MNKLLILLVIMCTSPIHAQNKEMRRDLVLNTIVHFDYTKEAVKNETVKSLSQVKFIRLDESEWKGAQKINRLIQNEVARVRTQEFTDELNSEYDKVLRTELKHLYNRCYQIPAENEGQIESLCKYYIKIRDGYSVEHVNAYFDVSALCDNILVAGMQVEYDLTREDNDRHPNICDVTYYKLHYYDLEKGVEIDPETVIDEKKKKSLYKLLKERIPNHLVEMADTLDFDAGLPLFNGASFYYFLNGNIEGDTEDRNILQVRLSFDEVLPFLNHNGPFKSYLDVDRTPIVGAGLCYNETRFSDYHFEESSNEINSIKVMVEHISVASLKNSSARVTNEKGKKELKIEFNENGIVSSYKSIKINKQTVDDSVAIEYNTNGSLKAIRKYKRDHLVDKKTNLDYKGLVPTKFYDFDENGNLVMYSKYDVGDNMIEDYQVKYVYYTYFGDRMISDRGIRTSMTAGYSWKSREYQIEKGELFQIGSFYSQKNKTISIEQKGDDYLFNIKSDKETVSKAIYKVVDGRCVSSLTGKGKRKNEMEYDSEGHVIKHTVFHLDDVDYQKYVQYSVTYDDQSRPVVYTTQYFDIKTGRVIKTKMHTFVYD